ncbi:MAG: asparagine--tRNA ligase [Pseudomonadales bacterium]|nr:asparagine--tRNA ligase [Pseudomonadales bacterium]
MTHIAINKILEHVTQVGQKVSITGWVRSRRSSKGGFSFVSVHDGSCFDPIQVVADKNLNNYDGEITHIGVGCSVIVTGTVVESQGKGQDREIQATALEVVGWVEDPESYPIAKKRHTFEYLRNVAHLRPRTNSFGAIARVKNAITQATHRYFHDNGFIWVNTPIITTSDCEGAGDLFRVSTLDLANLPIKDGEADFEQDFFGKEAFLTVSGQLNLEAYCLAMSKVYTFGPTFRAENSNTSRHLAEFWMIEPEIAFADLNDNAQLAESFLKHVISDVLDSQTQDMKFFEQRVDEQVLTRLQTVMESDFVRMDYTDAIDILKKSGKKFEFPVEWGLDLQSEHERFLTEQHVNGPVIVMNYPASIKAFYMRLNDDEKTVAAMDVLVPGVGEIIGGSQREERIEILDSRIDERLKEELWWYRDLRKYGTVPHAGFGLGLERLVLYVTGMENIRDAIPFPRVPNNAQF